MVGGEIGETSRAYPSCLFQVHKLLKDAEEECPSFQNYIYGFISVYITFFSTPSMFGLTTLTLRVQLTPATSVRHNVSERKEKFISDFFLRQNKTKISKQLT